MIKTIIVMSLFINLGFSAETKEESKKSTDKIIKNLPRQDVFHKGWDAAENESISF